MSVTEDQFESELNNEDKYMYDVYIAYRMAKARRAREFKPRVVLTIDEHSKICDFNEAGEKLLECSSSELIGQPISRVLPELTDIKLFQGTRSIPELLFLSRIGHHFEVMHMFGASFPGYLFFSDTTNNHGQHRLRVIICPAR